MVTKTTQRVATELLTKEAALNLAVKIVKQGVALRTDIQKLAVAAIGYANVHGDTSIAIRALEAVQSTKLMPKKFIAYCEHYGKLKFDKVSKSFVFNRDNDKAKCEPLELFKFLADQPSWYEFDNGEDKAPVELITRVEKLVGTKTDGLTPQEVELLAAIRKATEAYKLAVAQLAEGQTSEASAAAA